MDAFSYLSVLLSIIIGLAMTQVLMGYRALLLSRARVKLYWPTFIWSGLILVLATQNWWASFGLAAERDWTFAVFAVILLQTVFLYMMAALVLPDIPPDSGQDLKAHYYREARPFFAFALAAVGASVLKDVMIDGGLPDAPNLAFHAMFGAVAIAAMLVRRERFHEILAPLMAALSALYIGLLFARL